MITNLPSLPDICPSHLDEKWYIYWPDTPKDAGPTYSNHNKKRSMQFSLAWNQVGSSYLQLQLLLLDSATIQQNYWTVTILVVFSSDLNKRHWSQEHVHINKDVNWLPAEEYVWTTRSKILHCQCGHKVSQITAMTRERGKTCTKHTFKSPVPTIFLSCLCQPTKIPVSGPMANWICQSPHPNLILTYNSIFSLQDEVLGPGLSLNKKDT